MPNRPASAVMATFAAAALIAAAPAAAPLAGPGPTYADIADLADSAPLVVRVQIRTQSALEPARARNVRPGWTRLYLTGKAQALLFGRTAIPEDLAWLVDVPLDARGRPPRLARTSVMLFARPVANRPSDLQLVTPDAQIAWDPEREARVRGIIAELNRPAAPPRVRGVREAISVAGDLAGEGETQLFLSAADDAPVAVTVARKTGQPPRWTASFSEVVESESRPPQRDTLAWYRLACFLPRQLPPGVNLSESEAERGQAATDYAFVLRELGPCPRTRVFGLPR